MQAPAGRADVACERALHGHVDVLVVDIPDEGALLDLLGDVGKARVDCGLILGRDDALLGEHARVRPAAGDVVGRHVLVDLEARAKLLRELIHALLEPAAPQRHHGSFLAISPYSLPKPAGPSRRGGAASSEGSISATSTSRIALSFLGIYF